MTVRILTGDVRAKLAELPNEAVHMICTSPPYWGLRSYLPDGHPDKRLEIGLERTPDEYVANLVAVFRDCRRVLRRDGVMFINIGDCFATGGGKAVSHGGGEQGRRFKERAGFCARSQVPDRENPNAGVPTFQPNRMPLPGLKPKDLIGVPWLLAFALRADGWFLRAENIWEKPSCMPESVQDRTTRSHEHVFMFAKAQRYFYDAEAIREPDAGSDHPRNVLHRYEPSGGIMTPHTGIRRAAGRNGSGRNKRSVWRIAAEPNSDAHFAMMPSALAEVCIKAGTSGRGVCPHCGAPLERLMGNAVPTGGRGSGNGFKRDHRISVGGRGDETPWVPKVCETIGWSPSCRCPAHEPTAATVLDPFGGAGTTGLVADRLGRNAVLIDLNPSYAEMIERRLRRDAGMFAQVDASPMILEAAE